MVYNLKLLKQKLFSHNCENFLSSSKVANKPHVKNEEVQRIELQGGQFEKISGKLRASLEAFN